MRLPYRFGRYTLVEKIACGGTAEVFRATVHADKGCSKTVAIKRLLPCYCTSEEMEGMLVDEGRVLALLQHSAIVQVMELGCIERTPFLAMEFVDGIDCERLLIHLIRTRAPMPPAHACYLIGQVLEALAFAHDVAGVDGVPLQVVHRDISPSNILLSWSGEVKVTDFGIAKGGHRSQQTQAGQLKGKFAYMAPEQARGEEVDARADLFACGIVLFELVTAQRLFDAPADAKVLELVRRAELPQTLLASLPPAIRATLLLSLSALAAHRYQHAREMQADVVRCARGAGDPISSADFAGYLQSVFPNREVSADGFIGERATAGERATRILCPVSSRFLRRPVAAVLRACAAALLAGACLMMPPSGGAGGKRAEKAVPISVAEDAAAPAPVIPAAPPPLRSASGAVAIDTVPSGIAGTLILKGHRRAITTPVAIDGIGLDDGIDGAIELFAPGYRQVREAFRLDLSQPVFVRNFTLSREEAATLSIQARPWGIADVSGVARDRETPVERLKLKAGKYLLRVRHPPTNRVVEGSVALAGGQARRCIASFDETPRLLCDSKLVR